jgi:hypothetical protein
MMWICWEKKEKKETLTDASKEVGLEVNVEKTKCKLLPCYWNADQNRRHSSDIWEWQ